MIASSSNTRAIERTKYCTRKAPAVASRARKLCHAAQTQHQTNEHFISILQQCILAHFTTDGVERTPKVVADAWGRAWTERLQEICEPVPLLFQDPCSKLHASCDVTLVGVFHRDAANLRIVRNAISTAGPDAVVLEARPSFLTSYVHLTESLPEDLVMKMFDLPLHDLQEAFHYVGLEDRLAWHEALMVTNEELARHQARPTTSTTLTSDSSSNPGSSRTSSTCEARGSVLPMSAGAPGATTQTTIGVCAAPPALAPPPLSPASVPRDITPATTLPSPGAAEKCFRPLPSPSSALTASKIVSTFFARELALSEKVAAVLVAREYGLPLHGLELDDTEAYVGLLQGPLTDGQHRDGCSVGRTKSDSSSTADGGLLSMSELEAEQWRMAMASLEPGVAAAFEQWLQSMAPDTSQQLLQRQLVGLMPQCMNPESYMSYVDKTDALWSDERRVGRALAEQHRRLTAVREAHFLERLRQVAALRGPGEPSCRRLVAVVGRAHAARLRRALRHLQEQQQQH
ncbi:hypothetical protein Vretimale_10887 [Volvox reticuliferus]|uniref:Uncharacterized protein n=1 Tax=Volvox reticuliferus TaxID=1737510 RepID=A0A8J4GGH2_9CHLO|nr:hypothetical protein Vretimale_10887 [Volvox reticuliferus]